MNPHGNTRGVSRRELLGTAGAAAAGLVMGATTPPLAAATTSGRIRLAVSTYSYWHLKGPKYPIEKAMEHAASLGFDGVEVLHRGMEDDGLASLNRLKQAAFKLGLAMPLFSIHQDFVSPDPAERAQMVAHTKRCIDMAEHMGIPAIRLNSGRWKTIKLFDDLMKVKGDEPALPGYTSENAIQWCIECVEQCLPYAEKAGVVLAMENHWGLTTSVDTLLRIYNAVHSPWLGITLDTGNFPGEPYEGIQKLAPHATIVQAKTYYGGGEWYTLDLDYPRIAGILKRSGYHGWISLEMEGKESPDTAVAKSLQVLRSAFGATA